MNREIADAHERLIQDVLAGEATGAQSAELDRLLASDPDVQARHEELRGMFRLLSETPRLELPPGLHDDIVRAIAAEPGYGRPMANGRASVTALETPRRRRPFWPVFGAFLAGAVSATLVVTTIVRGPGVGGGDDGSHASGTIAPVEPAGTVLSTESLAAGGGRIELRTRRSGDDVRLEVHLGNPRPVDLAIDFPLEGLAITSTRWSPPPGGQVSLEDGTLTLAQAGPGDLVITFHALGASDAPLRIRTGETPGVLLHTGAARP